MPFSCDAKILPEQLREHPLIFVGWIDEAWERFVDAGTPFAMARDSRGGCVLRLTDPGFLSTQPKLKTGDEITIGTIVACFNANGEDIPYGRPYCIVDYNDHDTG